MRRALLLLAVIGLFACQIATSDVFEALCCDDACTDESPMGCTGDDGCCSCCSHSRTALPSPVAVAIADLTWSDVLAHGAGIGNAPPDEILHVPKRLHS